MKRSWWTFGMGTPEPGFPQERSKYVTAASSDVPRLSKFGAGPSSAGQRGILDPSPGDTYNSPTQDDFSVPARDQIVRSYNIARIGLTSMGADLQPPPRHRSEANKPGAIFLRLRPERWSAAAPPAQYARSAQQMAGPHDVVSDVFFSKTGTLYGGVPSDSIS